MIANPACAERGCACHDYRDGSGVEMMRRECVGLTDEEMHECWDSPLTPLGMKHARMIEAKLKEKRK